MRGFLTLLGLVFLSIIIGFAIIVFKKNLEEDIRNTTNNKK